MEKLFFESKPDICHSLAETMRFTRGNEKLRDIIYINRQGYTEALAVYEDGYEKAIPLRAPTSKGMIEEIARAL